MTTTSGDVTRRAFGAGLAGALAALDPTVATSDLVGIITQHVFETLLCFDGSRQIRPLPADGLPDVSPDGKGSAVKLRPGGPVLLGHAGGRLRRPGRLRRRRLDRPDGLICVPGFAIVLVVPSLQMLGGGLRHALDPRLQRLM